MLQLCSLGLQAWHGSCMYTHATCPLQTCASTYLTTLSELGGDLRAGRTATTQASAVPASLSPRCPCMPHRTMHRGRDNRLFKSHSRFPANFSSRCPCMPSELRIAAGTLGHLRFGAQAFQQARIFAAPTRYF